MSMTRHPQRRLLAAACVFVVAGAAMLLTSRPAWTNDIDLLRFNTAKPYLFIELDTSGSMNLAPDGQFLPAGGDDPNSKIYKAKEVLYDVFSEVDDIHLGFASYDQDEFGVVAKHWLYTAQAGTNLPIGYPAAGDQWTFGRHYNDTGEAGSCDVPIDLDAFPEEGRARLNTFAKLDQNGLGPTYLYFRTGGQAYQLSVTSGFDQLGQSTIKVDLTLSTAEPVGGGGSCKTTLVGEPITVQFSLDTEFLAVQQDNGFFAPTGAGEQLAGFWEWDDVTNSFTCPEGLPGNQRGSGWEGNYDGTFEESPGFPVDPRQDPFGRCPNRNKPEECDNLFRATTFSPFGRPLDRGDVLPLDWASDNKDAFLQRLAPNHLAGPADFGIASYFQDDPVDGYLRPKSAAMVPLIASGETPIGRASGDFRCYYRGNDDNKCPSVTYDEGWDTIAQRNDPEWGCRKPYQIVISDGLDTCGGPNPSSDTANLNAKAGVRTWVIAYGADCDAVSNPLQSMAQNGKGELVCPQDPKNLRDELTRILGIIREETRAFASAAAPTVQTAVADKIYLSNFTPLNNKSVWDGHINAFLKGDITDPLTGKPNFDSPNFLWDGGEVLKTTQAPTQAQADAGNLRLGGAANQRRIFYSRLTDSDGNTTAPGQWPFRRRLLDQIADGTEDDIRYDLWSGLQINFDEDNPAEDPSVDQAAKDRANQVLADTVAIKEHTLEDDTVITYVLGDMFHSTPIVMGVPPNVRYYALDLESDGTACADGNPGYRCFQQKHRFRRQVLLVGSNDGALHAFDAGLPVDIDDREDVLEVDYTDGDGGEIFAWVPRAVLPTVRTLAEGNNHRWAVDGNPVAADVFIDPVYVGAPNPDEREWRSVVITGLREGGSAYFALDLTQPDTYDGQGLAAPDNVYVPSCLGSVDLVEGEGDLPNPAFGDCGPTAYPAALWEFNDSILDTTAEPAEYRLLDEEKDDLGNIVGNGVGDLGDTWSTPTIGIVELCEGAECDPTVTPNDIVRKHVAVFGGGMDAGDKINPRRGYWVYMVDIETGQVIYKRRVDGAVAGNAAAVDTDQNGVLDRIYLATVGGFLYRIDISLDSDGKAPSLADTPVRDISGVMHTVKRVPETDASDEPLWEPRLIFNANFDGAEPTLQPRPLYQRPSVIFVAKLGLYALAFGTGDREDLWLGTTQEGRFYVFVDDTDFLDPASLPLTEANLALVPVNAVDVAVDYLLDRPAGQKGWFLPLDEAERVITEAFALSGVTFFSTFQPDVEVSGGQDPLCSKTGMSRVFIVNTTNANQFLRDEYGERSRYMTVANFVTNPYSEESQTRNPAPDDEPSPPLPEDLEDVMEALKSLFPSNCTFANYRIDIKTISADTGIIFIAPVPVCIIEKNWKGI